MQRNNGDMIISSSTHVSFESSATLEPGQHISKIYIYQYASDHQSVYIGSKLLANDELMSENKQVVPDHLLL